MEFWAAAGVIVLMVLGVLVQALRRNPADAAQAADLRVYRDQLREVERDCSRGMVSDEDAARVKAEVSRRLLDADRASHEHQLHTHAPSRVAMVLIAVALAGSVWLYDRLGAPDYPDFALSTRLAFSDEVYRNRPNQDQAEANAPAASAPTDTALLAQTQQLRADLQANPDDVETLHNLALSEASLGDMIAARVAQAHLIEVKGATAEANDHATLGWMMITAAGGYVSPEAETVLVHALEKDPKNGLARYYSGLMFAQVRRPDRAFELWQSLLVEGPENAPWIAPIRGSIENLATRAGIRFSLPRTAPEPGPDAADVAAVAEMTPEDRQAMIETMVEGLAGRLAAEGGPAQDWAKLITSLATLGNDDRARAILTEARTQFADQPSAMATINAAATQAGLAE